MQTCGEHLGKMAREERGIKRWGCGEDVEGLEGRAADLSLIAPHQARKASRVGGTCSVGITQVTCGSMASSAGGPNAPILNCSIPWGPP